MSDPRAMRWSVRVSASDRKLASVFARKARFDVGSPLAFDAEDPRTSAFEYLLGAVGADLVAGMKELCHRRRLEVDSVEALVQGELGNALVHLGVVGEDGDPGLAFLAIKVFVETLEEEGDIRGVWDEVLRRSPLYNTFKSVARFDVALHLSL